jgi:hypothetical protein
MNRKEKMKYYDYIRSESWQIKRRIFYSSNMYKHFLGQGKWNCYCCQKGDIPLDLHHRTYKRLGRERINIDLVPVCRLCHKDIHDLFNKKEISLWSATKYIKKRRLKEKVKETKNV